MHEEITLQTIHSLSPEEFTQRCLSIVKGLGFKTSRKFSAPGIELARQAKLVRESTDKMFRTEELWLLTFSHPAIEERNFALKNADEEPVKASKRRSNKRGLASFETWKLQQNTSEELYWQFLWDTLSAAESVSAKHIFTVYFGIIQPKDIEIYHEGAKQLGIQSSLLSGSVAVQLIYDYAFPLARPSKNIFSFKELREQTISQSQDANWRKQFQSLTALPTRVKLGQSDSELNEADLFRTLEKTGSFLLLGAPGAGKTTSLLILAEELARAGGRFPLLMPLNQYSGDLLANLSLVLCQGESLYSEDVMVDLLATGAMTVMLDGLNEVHPNDLRGALVEEINNFTSPENPTSRSQWIVAGRKYDYGISRPPLEHLEGQTWELQPLTSDLIYKFLVDGLREEMGKEAYYSLGAEIREICSNPLLLSMVVAVCQEKGKPPTGRGSLYQQFIDLLLQWKTNRNKSPQLQNSTYNTPKQYYQIAYSTMINLAEAMVTTAIPRREAHEVVTGLVSEEGEDAGNLANEILQDLVKRGLLKEQNQRLSFFHHTFQEYFQAYSLINEPISRLIPEEGVSGKRREAVIFLANLLNSPDQLNELILRALQHDSELAYDITRDAKTKVNPSLKYQLAEQIWKDIQKSSGLVGSAEPLTLKFETLANSLDSTVESLARRIEKTCSENVLNRKLLIFYREAGDTSSEQEILERLGVKSTKEVPEDLLFETALATRDHPIAIDLYTKYLERFPNSSAAYYNRANSYNALGKKQKALEDYEQAIKLESGNPHYLTSLAKLLITLNRKEEAVSHLQAALQLNSQYPNANFELGLLLEKAQPEEALKHFDKAVRFARSSADKIRFLEKLSLIQEKNETYTGAIRSLQKLIDLNPTDATEVKQWKQKIAALRASFDEAETRRSVRERLKENGEIPLPVLVNAILKASGLEAENITSQSLIVEKISKSQLPTPLLILLHDEFQLTGNLIQELIDSLPKKLKKVGNILLISSAEILDPSARIHLAALKAEFNIALITLVEAQEALLQGDRQCYKLIQSSLYQASKTEETFKYTTPVRERAEFFGRTEEIKNFEQLLIHDRQPVALYGIHKVGKSSLLMQIQRTLGAYYSTQVTPIFIEMNASIKDISELYYQILEKLPLETSLPPGLITNNYFQRTLSRFQQQKQKEYANHQILLILDEYPYIIPDRNGKGGIKDYLEALSLFKSLIQQSDGWFNLLPCGRTTALSRTAQWEHGENPFIGILKESFLGPLTQSETFELVTTLGAKAERKFSDEALNRVFEIAGGHPFFTRNLGSWVLKIHRSTVVTEDAIEKGANAYLADKGEVALFRAIYEERLDDDERGIVTQLALSKNSLSTKELLFGRTDRDTIRRLRDAVDNLLDTSILQRDKEGKLSHRYQLLAAVIKQDYEEYFSY
jgi:tetratricopeptide (TPR) repeat protein